MPPSKRPAWMTTVGLRMIISSALIVVLSLFWVYLVFFTELSMLAMAGIALLILLTLSTATAWTAVGVPRRDGQGDEERGDR